MLATDVPVVHVLAISTLPHLRIDKAEDRYVARETEVTKNTACSVKHRRSSTAIRVSTQKLWVILKHRFRAQADPEYSECRARWKAAHSDY